MLVNTSYSKDYFELYCLVRILDKNSRQYFRLLANLVVEMIRLHLFRSAKKYNKK